MISLRQLKASEKSAQQQQQVVAELTTLAKDIERCEKTMADLQRELEATNVKHQGRRSTREDVAYLTDLLDCAKRKLAWEKQLASLQKRTPAVLEKVSKFMNEPNGATDPQMPAEMLQALQAVQAAMERLHNIKLD